MKMKIFIPVVAIGGVALLFLYIISHYECWNKKPKELIIPADVINACLNSGGKLEAISNGCETKIKCMRKKERRKNE